MDMTIEKDKIRLNELIARLTGLVTIERIYSIEQVDGDNIRTGLIILISDKRNKILSELTPILNVVFADYSDYWYRAYFSYMVKDGIKKGNLFFYETCRQDNLLYTNPTSDFVLIPEPYKINGLIDKAKHNFQKEINKVKAFKEGATFYFEKGNYPQTAFMVHQQIEISYRAIEMFTMGKDKITHSIRVHQDCVRPYMHDLGNVFNEANADEDKLMRHLDDAYLAVRYEDGYQMKKEKIILAIEKAELVFNMINQIYEDMINAFQNKYSPEKNTEESKTEKIISPNPPTVENVLKSIIEKIALYKGAKRIYCFGKRTHEVGRRLFINDNENELNTHVHHDLLVITEENIEQELYDLQGQINSNNDLSHTVLLLVHKIGDVKKCLHEANRFFSLVLRKGELVHSYNDNSAEWQFSCGNENQQKDKDLDKFRINWHNRYWNAKGLIDASMNIMDYECCAIQILMYHQAVEQICLGLMYSFLDYNPVRRNLNHLFDVCCSFMTFPDVAFPRRTDEDLKLFNILVESFNQVRYKGWFDFSDEVVTILGKRCENLLEMANNVVKNYLEELKNNSSLNTFDVIRSIEIAE